MSLGHPVPAPEALHVGFAFLFGLVIGSFANVLIHRLPREESLWGRSRCPGCGAMVAAWDNVPLLSYLILRGRCRRCGCRISPRYPAVEAATGLLYALAVLRLGLPLEALDRAAGSAVLTAAFAQALFAVLAWILACLAFPTALLVLALIDAEHQILPNRITKPGIVAGLAVSGQAAVGAPLGAVLARRLCPPVCLPATTLECAAAACLGYGAVWLVYHAARGYYRRVKHEDVEPMGFGDAKLLAMMGAFRGSVGLWVGGFVGTVLGALYGIGLVAARKGEGRTRIPLGTFLCAGALLELLWGAELLSWYRGLFSAP